jgi:hypothetical protein
MSDFVYAWYDVFSLFCITTWFGACLLLKSDEFR